MNEDDTIPGLTQGEDGTISIGPAASKASRERAEKEAIEHAQSVVHGINEETKDPNARAPGEEAGS